MLAVPHAEWPDRTIGELTRGDLPVARPDWSLGQALRTMTDGDVDHLPVLDGDQRLVGIVTSDAIIDRARIMQDLDIHA